MAFLNVSLFRLTASLLCLLLVHGQDLRSNSRAACQRLKAKYQAQTSVPGSEQYEANVGENWSESTVERSSCLFQPTSAQHVAGALNILTRTRAKFAVRGGGHMPVPEAAAIKDGVLISTELLNLRELSKDKTLAKLGPGNRWGDVYAWISSNDLAVAGGRYGPVGVPGLLLGGGISYFGSKRGWSVNSLRNAQVVLANGTIVNANAKENPDLLWALKGGSSNFGIVTRFDVETFRVDDIYGGTTIYKPEAVDDYLRAIANFVTPDGGSDDVDASINPTLQLNVSTGQFTLSSIACHLGSDPAPKAFADFASIPVISTANSVRPDLVDFTNETALPVYGDRSRRWLFASTSLKATADAVYLTNKTFTDTTASMPELKNVLGLAVASTQQTITKAWLQAARASGGDAIDLDPKDGSLIVYLINAVWENAEDDQVVNQWAKKTIANVDAAAKAQGLYYPFSYLNDGLADEDIFGKYGGGKSLPRLQQISKRYDPNGVFQKLMPGGFKIFPKDKA